MDKFCLLFICIVVTCSFVEAQKKCHFKPKRQQYKCPNLINAGLTFDEKKRILKQHNALRYRVAKGLEKAGSPGPQPPAVNMRLLEWDSELEAAAQQWANGCVFEHDPCNQVGRYSFGQNLGLRTTTGNVKGLKLEQAIRGWYDEVKYFDKKNVQNYRFSPRYGHYSQLVWAETNKIGCGVTRYQENGYKKLYLVCNYGPAGNTRNFPVYKSHK